MDNKTIEKVANFLKEFPVHPNQQIYGTTTEEKKENWVVRPYRVKYIKIIISQEEIDAEIICISPEGIFGSVRYTNIGTSVFLTEEEAQKRADKKNEELKKIKFYAPLADNGGSSRVPTEYNYMSRLSFCEIR